MAFSGLLRRSGAAPHEDSGSLHLSHRRHATLVALLVLLLLELFLTCWRNWKTWARAITTSMAALRYLLLIQPQRLYELFPMALLVGGLLGMGALASGSELIVMRAAGLSLTRLTRSVLQAGLLLSLAVLLVGEFIAPPLEQFAREQRAIAKGENLAIRGGRGFWARDGDYFIHVQGCCPASAWRISISFKVNPDARLETATSRRARAIKAAGCWKA
jgi:lipopolysaccharide export system permease protein